MPRFLYSLLWFLIVPFALLRLCWRARKQPEYLQHVGERFGAAPVTGQRPCLWLHAVSVGETRAAQPIIKALLERYSDHDLLLTHMTPTGRATGAELFGKESRVRQCYLPYDMPWAVRRFLRRARPVMGLIMETEVWPNVVQETRQAGIPILLINARLSERSARGYTRLGALACNTFAAFSAIGAQTQGDAQRLQALSADPVVITGNMKFDVAVFPTMLERGQSFRALFVGRPILLAASTREGEEELLLDAFLRQASADTLLVLVPRHPQRFDEVAQLVQRKGLSLARRSAGALMPEQARVWLGDSMGEMLAYFSMADVAIIGGSWMKLGGQNLIEACAVGVPVIVGPHTFNFAEATIKAIEADAARRCADLDEAITEAEKLLHDESRRQTMGNAGKRFITAHSGATQKTLDVIGSCWIKV